MKIKKTTFETTFGKCKIDSFWWESFKILFFGFIFETIIICMIGIPNLIFGLSWTKYISWLLPIIWLIIVLFAVSIIFKGLWIKIRSEF